MNNRLKTTLALFAASSLLFASCSREDKDDENTAGKGGQAILRLTPKHHAKLIDSCKVYIKYNTQDKPAFYDDSTWCIPVDGKPVGTFSGLKKGKYYLYGYGWDEAIAEAVDGGAPFEIIEEKAYDYSLSVTEDH